MKTSASITTEPVRAGDFNNVVREWGRDRDVEAVFGLKRSTLRNLHKKGLVKGVLLRCTGRKLGCRLWAMDSIRAYIQQQMAVAEKEAAQCQA